MKNQRTGSKVQFQFSCYRAFSCLLRQRSRLLSFDVVGVGRGATGRRFSFGLLAGRVVFPSPVLEFARGGLVLEFSTAEFALTRFTFAGRVVLAFALPFAFAFGFSFAFLFLLRRGLFSFAFKFALRFSVESSAGLTVSGVSPSFVGRLMSIATV